MLKLYILHFYGHVRKRQNSLCEWYSLQIRESPIVFHVLGFTILASLHLSFCMVCASVETFPLNLKQNTNEEQAHIHTHKRHQWVRELPMSIHSGVVTKPMKALQTCMSIRILVTETT